MDKYTMYCTKEQTMKAYKLGAPILTTNEHLYNHPHEYKYWVGVDIQGNLYAAKIPTAEQMIGWLRVKGFMFILSDDVDCNEGNNWWIGINGELITQGCNENKELAAIDAALEYIESIKQ